MSDQNGDRDARTEREKLEAGDLYCFLDAEVAARKQSAVVACRYFNDADPTDVEAQTHRARTIRLNWRESLGTAAVQMRLWSQHSCWRWLPRQLQRDHS